MTILHGELFNAESVSANTLTSLSPVEQDGDLVKSLPNPAFAGAIAFSANLQYATLHNADSWGGTDPRYVIPPAQLSGHERDLSKYFMRPVQVTPHTKYSFKVYHDGSAAEDVAGILWHVYGAGRSIPYSQITGIPTSRRVSKGSNLTANTWTTINTITDLNPAKQYALIGALGYASDLRGIRFRHVDFQGLSPVLPGHDDVDNGFDLLPLCPTFSGASALTVDGYIGTAGDATVIVLMREL